MINCNVLFPKIQSRAEQWTMTMFKATISVENFWLNPDLLLTEFYQALIELNIEVATFRDLLLSVGSSRCLSDFNHFRLNPSKQIAANFFHIFKTLNDMGNFLWLMEHCNEAHYLLSKVWWVEPWEIPVHRFLYSPKLPAPATTVHQCAQPFQGFPKLLLWKPRSRLYILDFCKHPLSQEWK